MGCYNSNGVVFFRFVGLNDWVGCRRDAARGVQFPVCSSVNFTLLVELSKLFLDLSLKCFSAVRSV